MSSQSVAEHHDSEIRQLPSTKRRTCHSQCLCQSRQSCSSRLASGNRSNTVGYFIHSKSTITYSIRRISRSTFLQGILWKLNKFDALKTLPELEHYTPRHDPTVAAIHSHDSEAADISGLTLAPVRDNEFAYYTGTDYTNAYSAGSSSPLKVVEALLPLIRRDTKPPGKHSIGFLEVRPDLVTEAAKASTDRYKAGKPLSPLDGVPIAVKDEVDLKGYRRTLASNVDFTNPLDETAWCVRKWEEAGAIIIGKTNMHEIGLDTSNNNPITGTPLNPHNPAYYTGGSSGGSAYAVAAGICPIALGADGGGSIRIPSSFCGIFGLKTTHGHVSASPTRHELGVSVGVIGPMASNIADLALAWRVMAQPCPSDPSSPLFPSPLLTTSHSSPKQSRKILGICAPWLARADPDVRIHFDAALTHYQSLGYTTVSIPLPFLPEGQKAHSITILSEMRAGLPTSTIAKLTYPHQLLLSVASGVASAQDFLAAQKIRHCLMQHLAWLFATHGEDLLILTPTCPAAGWKVKQSGDVKVGGYGVSDGDMTVRSMEFIWLANFAGVPAMSVPCGYSEDDVPVGLMVSLRNDCLRMVLMVVPVY